MTIFRYLFKETIKTQIAVLFVLLLIFVSQQFIRVLSKAMKGDIPGELIAKIVMVNLPALGMLMLPISLFIGILLAHGRLHAESEIVVLNACGYSQYRVLGAAMALAMVTMGLSAANAFWLSPYSEDLEAQILEQADADAGLATLKQGRFERLAKGRAVVYIEEFGKDKTLDKVFIAQSPRTAEERPAVVVADTGQLVSREDGALWLQLQDGQRYEGHHAARDFRILDFQQYEIRMPQPNVEQRGRRTRALDTWTLWQSDSLEHQTELQWRIAQVFAIPILTLIVVPLAVVNPRQGRYAKLLPALMLFLAYFMLLSAARSAVEDGKLPLYPGMWLVHGGALLLGIMFNMGNTAWYNRLRARMSGHYHPRTEQAQAE